MQQITLGLIGGGQLGKMLAPEALRMGLKVVALDPSAECPAAHFVSELIVADFKDADAIRRLAQKCDVLTYEIELADTAVLAELEQKGCRVFPSAAVLHTIQDKGRQKTFLQKAGLPVPPFLLLESGFTVEKAQALGFPLLLKNRCGGYDGRGNRKIAGAAELQVALLELEKNRALNQVMLEAWVPFEKEVSLMVARQAAGQTQVFPLAENEHENHILKRSLVPARVNAAVAQEAQKIALKTVEALQGVGIFGVEMFVEKSGRLSINEIAPRPHNSGHYSIEACDHSQFEMHLRAGLGWPLVNPGFRNAAVMINLLGTGTKDSNYRAAGLEEALQIPGLKLHLYGKSTMRAQRKMGHFTVVAQNLEAAMAQAQAAQEKIKLKETL